VTLSCLSKSRITEVAWFNVTSHRVGYPIVSGRWSPSSEPPKVLKPETDVLLVVLSIQFQEGREKSAITT
ncbi:hypothetical protein BG011_001371, partial [Mortierella polycephala]